MSLMDNFGVLILTYGRPDNVMTYKTLRALGYTGKIYLVCSTDDSRLEDYKKNYGDEVVVFSKDTARKYVDMGDNLDNDKVVIFARNYAFKLAKKLKLKYFLELDDDYFSIHFKIPLGDRLFSKPIKDLDRCFETFVTFLHNTPRVHCIALGQTGDYIGGAGNGFWTDKNRRRKLMNAYFNATDRPYNFYGRINEDTTNYVLNGSRGYLYLTNPFVTIYQVTTQLNEGGLTDIYLEVGTYVKSFYSVIFNPSSVKVSLMTGGSYKRLHHHVDWRRSVPKILREEHKRV